MSHSLMIQAPLVIYLWKKGTTLDIQDNLILQVNRKPKEDKMGAIPVEKKNQTEEKWIVFSCYQ